MKMFLEPKCISHSQCDIIKDVAFDHYGKRMAVCSEGQLIKVWDKCNGTEDWKMSAEWKAHDSSVCKIIWAHPEFGQVLATCSSDGTCAIWEEFDVGTESPLNKWARKAKLVGSRSSIIDIKFAPRAIGLLFAICSSDGVVRFYKAPNTLDLSHWILQQEIFCNQKASCITWNPNCSSELYYSMKYFKLNNCTRKEVESVSGDNIYSKLPPVLQDPNLYVVVLQDPMLIVGLEDIDSNDNNIVMLEYIPRMSRWCKVGYHISGDPSTSSPPETVRDMAFAPRLGRSYDVLAIAANDIKIYALYQVFNSLNSLYLFKLYLNNSFGADCGPFYKLNWNLAGNILKTVGGNRCVRVWKQCHEHTFNERKSALSIINDQTFKKISWKSILIFKLSGFQC